MPATCRSSSAGWCLSPCSGRGSATTFAKRAKARWRKAGATSPTSPWRWPSRYRGWSTRRTRCCASCKRTSGATPRISIYRRGWRAPPRCGRPPTRSPSSTGTAIASAPGWAMTRMPTSAAASSTRRSRRSLTSAFPSGAPRSATANPSASSRSRAGSRIATAPSAASSRSPSISAYVAAQFAALDIGIDRSVALFGLDGYMRARTPVVDGMYDRPKLPVAGGIFEALHHSSVGTYQMRSTYDGILRVFGYRAVDGRALAVVVGKSVAEILTPYRIERGRAVFGGLSASAFIALFIVMLSRSSQPSARPRTRACRRARRAGRGRGELPRHLRGLDRHAVGAPHLRRRHGDG